MHPKYMKILFTLDWRVLEFIHFYRHDHMYQKLVCYSALEIDASVLLVSSSRILSYVKHSKVHSIMSVKLLTKLPWLSSLITMVCVYPSLQKLSSVTNMVSARLMNNNKKNAVNIKMIRVMTLAHPPGQLIKLVHIETRIKQAENCHARVLICFHPCQHYRQIANVSVYENKHTLHSCLKGLKKTV